MTFLDFIYVLLNWIISDQKTLQFLQYQSFIIIQNIQSATLQLKMKSSISSKSTRVLKRPLDNCLGFSQK